jgi:hypothetical protein
VANPPPCLTLTQNESPPSPTTLPPRDGTDDSLRVLLCETSDVTPAPACAAAATPPGGGGGGDAGGAGDAAAAAAAAAGDGAAAAAGDGAAAAATSEDVVGKWRWPAAVEALIRRHGLVPELAQVPGQAPRTREQWEEWNGVVGAVQAESS